MVDRLRGLLALGVLAAVCGCAALARSAAPAVVAPLLAGEVFATDDDPELVRAALPAALKTVEALLLERPRDTTLLVGAARGFAVYAWAFPESDAVALEASDAAAAKAARERAGRLYLRAVGYGLRALGTRHRGFAEELARDPAGAVAVCDGGDVAALLWTGAAWGGAIAASHGEPARVAELGSARALVERAAVLAPRFEDGATLAALLPFEGLPAALGGDAARARALYERAGTLADHADAALDVLYASSVALPAADRRGFETALRHALTIDSDALPRRRLANRIAQRRARALLARADDLFLEAATP